MMRRNADSPLIGIGAGAFAVLCCAGLPALGALIGGITLAAIVGVAAGALALAAAAGAAVLLFRVRRQRSQRAPHQGRPFR